MARIDAHQHFWQVARGDYGWLTPASGILYRDYGPADLKPALDAAGIDYCITVQAAESEAETEFMLDLAEANAFVAGVVGWLDLESPDFAERLARFRQRAKFVGLRPMLQGLPDDAFSLRPAVLANLRHLAETGFPFDFLTFPRHLPHVLTVLETVSGLHAVIDHISKPPIKDGTLDPWRADIRAVARHPNLYCKLSGMVTEADHTRWTASDLEPYILHVLDVFSPDRLLFGSDWPVALLAADYARVIDTLTDILSPRLTSAELAAVFGGNAEKFYRLRLSQ